MNDIFICKIAVPSWKYPTKAFSSEAKAINFCKNNINYCWLKITVDEE